MNILQAMDDPRLLGTAYAGATWTPWRAVLAAAFALPMDAERRALFAKLAGGREPPAERVRELFAVAGRRAGKSHIAAALAVYLATVGAEAEGTLARLARGERGVVAVIACDRAQARTIMGYVVGLLEASPVLAPMVTRRERETVELTNRAAIEVQTNSFRSVRGRTLLAAILDELAFYRSEDSASPDVETYRALVPGLATTGGLLVGISSPYSRRGLLWEKHRRHYGAAGNGSDVLVIQGATRDLNPNIPERVVEDAGRDDPAAALSEWGGQFRSDLENFLTRETVESCTRGGPLELPYNAAKTYRAFVDPSGGGPDEYTLAIGHREGERAVIDLVRGQRGAPAAITAQYAALLKAYGLDRVAGDKYGGTWPADEFRRHGITYAAAEKSKSDLYLEALAAFNSGRVELPPDARLAAQLLSLERRTARSGKDSIDHPPGGHDDRANACAGLAGGVSEVEWRGV